MYTVANLSTVSGPFEFYGAAEVNHTPGKPGAVTVECAFLLGVAKKSAHCAGFYHAKHTSFVSLLRACQKASGKLLTESYRKFNGPCPKQTREDSESGSEASSVWCRS